MHMSAKNCALYNLTPYYIVCCNHRVNVINHTTYYTGRADSIGDIVRVV